jgi:ketosteroid isomerase-like protein
MSQENEGIVRRFYALWDSADFDPMVELLDPEVVASAPEGWPESGPWKGRDEVLAQVRAVRANFGDQTFVVKEIRARGDRVVTRHRVLARGARSGLNTEVENSGAFRVRAGKIVEARFFWRHEDALKAVGLEE